MIRRALLRGTRLKGYGSLVFQTTTPTPVTKCPFSGASAEPQLKTVNATTETATCPIMGATPVLQCPLEATDQQRALPFKQIVGQMGKMRLSSFVTATAVVGYVMCGGTSPVNAAALTLGTLLQSCSANTANQIIEVQHDAKMKRTCRRPLPMGYISRTGAMTLSAAELAVGSGILYLVSPPASALGMFNWVLYVAMYTPLKRVSAVNTWFGSIVGGIPPLMGGIAAAGTVTGPAWLLGALLVAWQIPHFMGLSFHCRRDYEVAGYKMLAFYNPWRASFYAVFMSVVMAITTLAGPTYIGMPVESWYYLTMTVANTVMIYKSWLFHLDPKKHCRGCFVFSYLYLTAVLATFMVNHFEPVKNCIAAYNYLYAMLNGSEDERVVAIDQ